MLRYRGWGCLGHSVVLELWHTATDWLTAAQEPHALWLWQSACCAPCRGPVSWAGITTDSSAPHAPTATTGYSTRSPWRGNSCPGPAKTSSRHAARSTCRPYLMLACSVCCAELQRMSSSTREVAGGAQAVEQKVVRTESDSARYAAASGRLHSGGLPNLASGRRPPCGSTLAWRCCPARQSTRQARTWRCSRSCCRTCCGWVAGGRGGVLLTAFRHKPQLT